MEGKKHSPCPLGVCEKLYHALSIHPTLRRIAYGKPEPIPTAKPEPVPTAKEAPPPPPPPSTEAQIKPPHPQANLTEPAPEEAMLSEKPLIPEKSMTRKAEKVKSNVKVPATTSSKEKDKSFKKAEAISASEEPNTQSTKPKKNKNLNEYINRTKTKMSLASSMRRASTSKS